MRPSIFLYNIKRTYIAHSQTCREMIKKKRTKNNMPRANLDFKTTILFFTLLFKEKRWFHNGWHLSKIINIANKIYTFVKFCTKSLCMLVYTYVYLYIMYFINCMKSFLLCRTKTIYPWLPSTIWVYDLTIICCCC